MNRDCIDEIEKIIGRALSGDEANMIEAKIVDQLRQFSRKDPQGYAAMPQAQRLQAAAQLAAQQQIAAATLKRQRVAATIVTHQRLASQFTAGQANGLSGARSLADVLEKADIYMKGVAREYFSNLMDTIAQVEPKWFGLMEDPRQVRAFVQEVMGNASGVSGSKEAQGAAKAWLATAEAMRQRFNRAGGDIGRLAYGYLPQPHDAGRIRQVARDVWTNQVLPLLDRSRYVDLSGARMADASVLDILRTAYDSITTDGANTLVPGSQAGTGARSNRGSDHRVIHFKDADSYLAYMGDYGRGSVFSAMQSHVSGMAKSIGLIEQFSPNPELMFRTFNDMATKADSGMKRFGRFLVTNEQLWSTLAGHSAMVEHQRLADIAQGARNIEVFGKLQAALVSSINDLPTFFITTRFNKLPIFDALTNYVRSFGADTKDFANRAGLITEGVIGDMNRWAESNLKDNWTGRLSTATMKASLLEGWTDTIRRAFSLTMMGGLGKISRSDWTSLHADDRARMEAKGVLPAEWKLWQQATPQNWRGSQMLTPEAVRGVTDAQMQAAGLLPAGAVNPENAARLRDTAVSRLLGIITDESEYASVAPDLHTRTLITWGGQARGTMGGELGRSLMLFKGFPISLLTRHWGRMFGDEMSAASRVEYAASVAVGLTVFGALAMQLKDLKDGKDPRAMDSPKFWLAAIAQGGGMGFAGDLIYQAAGGMQSQAGVSTAANTLSAVAGPVVGSMAEFADLTLGNLGQWAKGADTHAGAEALRFARSHTPFVNLWYAKSVIDHAALNDLQEYLSPGYLARMQRRVQKDWGQSYWWNPASGTPDRGPDFEKALGQ